MEQSISISGKRYLLEPLLLLVVSPLLLFPIHFPPLLVGGALLCLLIPFFLRRNATGRWLRHTPVNGLVVVLACLLLPLSFIMSPLPWEISWPRLTVLAWSLALFFTITNNAPAEAHMNDPRMPAFLNTLTMTYLTGGALAVFVGLLGMRRVDKLFFAAIPAPLESLLGGFHPNELAGLITLFLPLAAALCLRSWRTRLAGSGQFIAWFGLTIYLTGCLLLTQSRTSLVAVGISLVLVLLLSGRRGWRLLALGMIGLVIALFVVGVTRTMDVFVYAGANSWASVIGPRMRLWEQAFFALREFWPLGMGLGVFYAIAPYLYPQVPLSEAVQLPPAAADAHNLYLQTALDFGLPGLLLFLFIIALALVHLLQLLRRDSADGGAHGLSRAWVVGALGTLVAHLLYSLTDAVALGAISGVAFWFLLGMVMATTADKRSKRTDRLQRWRRSLRATPGTVIALMIGVAVVVLFVLWQLPSRAVFANGYAAQLAAESLLTTESASTSASGAAAVDLPTVAATACRVNWYQGLLANAALNVVARNAAWERLLNCTAEFIPFMAVLAPSDTALARLAMETRPESAAAHFWLAESLAGERPQEAIAAYEAGLVLAPEDGVRWQMLGDLLIERDPAAAIEAYLQSCYHGDPGANGCWRAGNAAEQQGDIAAAITYYRLSKWDVAHQRAAELESGQ